MNKGLYRMRLSELGECARVHPSAGDAAPFLDRATYELLSFQPPFDALPRKQEFERRLPNSRLPRLRCEESWAERI